MALAVITGASKGIGKAIAEKLLQKKFDIAICARSSDVLEHVREEWEHLYPQSRIMTATVDMQQQTEVKQFARAILEHFGHVDILVNNAGFFYPGKLADEAETQLESMMATNLFGAYYLTRELLPSMKERAMGHIFNVCSIASLKAYPNGGSYSVTKYALLGFNDNLREELREESVKVTAIIPGAVWTDSWKDSGLSSDTMMDAADIANMLWAAYELSPRANVEHIVLRPLQGNL